jgi:hypothetical protein
VGENRGRFGVYWPLLKHFRLPATPECILHPLARFCGVGVILLQRVAKRIAPMLNLHDISLSFAQAERPWQRRLGSSFCSHSSNFARAL